jgi:pimeloyl-ACP methyl ester carboxylesterase
MSYATVNGQELYYETRGGPLDGARPLVLLHGGLQTTDLAFGPLLEPLAAGRPVIAIELQGHGHTPDTDRPLAIETLAADVTGLLDQLGVARADLFGFSLGGLVAWGVALAAPNRVGRLIAASADPYRPPGRESQPLTEDKLPTQADFEAMRAAYEAVASDPAHFEKFAARNSVLVHEFAGWTAEQLGALRVPTMLIFGDRDFSPLTDVVELLGFVPGGQLAVLPATTHMGVTQRPARLLALITPFLDGA